MDMKKATTEQLERYSAELDAKYERHLKKKEKTLDRTYQAHTEPLSEKLKHWGANTLRAASTGVAGLADIIPHAAEGVRYMSQHEANSMAPKHFPEPEPFGSSSWLPHIAHNVGQKIDKLTGGYSIPRTPGERAYNAVAEAILPLPPIGKAGQLLANASKAPRIAKTLKNIGAPTATNLGANAGSALAAHEYLEGRQDPSTLAALGAGTAGALGGAFALPAALRGMGSVGKTVLNPRQGLENAKDTFARKVGEVSKWNPPKFERQKRANLTPTLGLSSDNPTVFKQEIALAHDPVTEGRMKRVFEGNQQQMAKNLGVINHKDLYEATKNPRYELAREGAKNLKAAKSAEYERLNASFKPRDTLAREGRDLIDIQDVMDSLKKEGVGLETPTAQKLFEERPSGEYLKKLQKMAKEEQLKRSPHGRDAEELIQSLQDLNINPQTIRNTVAKEHPNYKFQDDHATHVAYPELDEIRKKALNEVEGINPKQNANEYREAKGVLHKLADKRHKFIESIGTPEEVAASRGAKKMWAEWMDKLEGGGKLVWDIVEAPNQYDAFKYILDQSEPRYLDIVVNGTSRSNKPKLLDTIVTHMGKQNATGTFNLNNFGTQWESIKVPAIKNKIINLRPEKQREPFRNTVRFISQNKSELADIANTSKTSHWNKWLEFPKKYATALAATGLMGAAGVPGSWSPLALSLLWDVTKYGGAKLMTDRIFLERINRVITSPKANVKALNVEALLKYPPVRKALRQADQAAAASRTASRIVRKEDEDE